VIPLAINALLGGKPFELKNGDASRDYLHVVDVAAAFCSLIDVDPGSAVDVCSGDTIRLRNIVELIGRQIGRPELITYRRAEGIADPSPTTGDSATLRSAGWAPTIDHDAGIQDVIAHWKGQKGTDSE